MLVIVTVVLWAVAFPAIRVALETTSAVSLSFWRLAGATLCLLIAARIMRSRPPSRRDLPQIALCGATGMAAYQLLLNLGERSVPAGTASLIVATAPIYSVLIASRVLGERIPGRRWLGLAIALAGSGAVALSADGTLSFSRAAVAVLGAAMVQGLYHAAQRPLLVRYTALEVATYAMAAGTIMLLPTLPWAVQSAADTSVRSWSALALYAVPVVAIGVAWAWLGEQPALVTVVAGAVALVGVAVGSSSGGRRVEHLADADRVAKRITDSEVDAVGLG